MHNAMQCFYHLPHTSRLCDYPDIENEHCLILTYYISCIMLGISFDMPYHIYTNTGVLLKTSKLSSLYRIYTPDSEYHQLPTLILYSWIFTHNDNIHTFIILIQSHQKASIHSTNRILLLLLGMCIQQPPTIMQTYIYGAHNYTERPYNPIPIVQCHTPSYPIGKAFFTCRYYIHYTYIVCCATRGRPLNVWMC